MRISIVVGCLLSVAAFARTNKHVSPMPAKLALMKEAGVKDEQVRKMNKVLAARKQSMPRTMQLVQPEAPSADCLFLEAYYYASEDTTCNDEWMAWDDWCIYDLTDYETYEAVC